MNRLISFVTLLFLRLALTKSIIELSNAKQVDWKLDDQERDVLDRNKIESDHSPHDVRNRGAPSLEQHYWIETLVFADHTVQERFATREEAQAYVITLMRMTDKLFHHPSLGTNLSLSVRDIIWVSEQTSNELLWGPSLIRSVHRFCNWALTHHYVRYNYDHALFISRNIVQAAGISPLSQMCQMQFSCTLAEDSGFFSAYPIAHEIMHSLGVEHDGEGNGCDASGVAGNIMAPLILSASHNHHWSDCTRLVLQAAMSSNKFTCLQDYPIDENRFSLLSEPGKHWSLDRQCHVLAGSNASRHCPGVEEHACQELWCSITGSTDQCDRMLNHGLLDGTECGPGRTCQDGKCVQSAISSPDSNGWTSFTAWTACSRTCGIGTQYRTRSCLRSSKDCPGLSTEYRLCRGKVQTECLGLVDFREHQCQRFNHFKMDGIYHTWLPHVDLKNQCRLNCRSQSTGQMLDGAIAVRDSTSCTYGDPDHRCVQSVCVPFDCLGRVNGTAKRDECGVCKGDGSSCTRIQHVITRSINPDDGYRIVYIIPRYARGVEITHNSSTHLLALFDMHQFVFLMRGEEVQEQRRLRRIFFATEFLFEHIAGQAIFSKNQTVMNRISSRGPIVGDLSIRIRQQNDTPHATPWIALHISYLISTEQ